jgi:hypothetical protein
MKKLLTRFMISNSLDQGRPLTRFWRKRVLASPEAERFQSAAQEWDRRLKEPVPLDPAVVPPGLHAGIMRAVRESRREKEAEETGPLSFGVATFFRYGVAALLLGLLASGVWLSTNRLRPRGGLPAAGRERIPAEVASALPTVGPVVEQLATNGVALLRFPMNRQVEDLSRDLRQAAQFLLASLP